jgi:hypothetical protein
MSTKKDKTNSVIAELQAVVDELRVRGLSDVDVHSLVNMIWQGWLVNGQPTKEYMNLMIQAQASKRLVEKEEPESVIVSRSGESIRSS